MTTKLEHKISDLEQKITTCEAAISDLNAQLLVGRELISELVNKIIKLEIQLNGNAKTPENSVNGFNYEVL
jgi:uncharacterized coiled-coil protein SlyX